MIQVILSLGNFALMNISALLFSYYSIISVMPVTREEKIGEKAWEDCYRYRKFMSIAVSILVITMFFWIFIPINELNWTIFDRSTQMNVLIALLIIIPCLIILIDLSVSALNLFNLLEGSLMHPKPSAETSQSSDPIFLYFIFMVSFFAVLFVTYYI